MIIAKYLQRKSGPGFMSGLKKWLISEKSLVYIALFLPVIIWLYPLFLPRNLAVFPGIDGSFYFYPMTKVGMDMFRQGLLPLWTSLIHCGFPLLADGQGALLYPLNLLFFLSLPAPIANNYCIAFQILLTTAFMYAFCRRLGISRMSSVVASWLWVFFGPVSVSWGSPALNGLIWWPLLFLLAETISEKCDWRIIALAGTIMGFDWLSGFPQTTFYGIAGASMFFMFRLLTRHSGQWKNGIPPLSGWIVAGIIGAGIAAPQIMTTMEMSHFSVRTGGTDFAFASLGSMFPSGLLGFFLQSWNPLFAYSLAGSNLHIGFICLAAALLTFRKKMGPLEYFLWFFVVTGCLLAMGKYTPLYKLVHMIPGFSFFRYPYRFLYWTSFAVAILSAMGLDRLFSPSNKPDELRRKMVVFLAGLTGLAIAASLLGSAAFHLARNILFRLAQSIVNNSIAGQAYKLQDQAYYSAKINTMIADIAQALSPLHAGIIISCIFAIGAVVVLTVLLHKTQNVQKIKTAMYLLIGCNVLALLHGPIGPMARTQDFLSFPLAPRCSTSEGLSRLYNVNSSEEIRTGTYYRKKRLDPNFNMLAGIDHVGVYSALGTSRYFDFFGALGTVNLAFAVPAVSATEVTRYRQILNLSNVRYVACRKPMPLTGFQLISDENTVLYKNNECLPRAFVVPRAIRIASARALLDSLHSPLFDPRASVLIETDPGPASAIDGRYSPAEILPNDNGIVSIRAKGPGWLVFSETYYPGWSARVDGKDAAIFQGDYVFRTLPLEPGDHVIDFRFESRSFRTGLFIASATGVLVLLLLVIGVRKATRIKNAVTV